MRDANKSKLEVDFEFRRRIVSVCRNYLSGEWTNVNEDDLDIERITGGCSNRVFRCSMRKIPDNDHNKTNQTVLIRIYGSMSTSYGSSFAEEDSSVSDRLHQSLLQDIIMFTILSERGLGPKLLAIFPQGRLEQYIWSRHLSPCEMFLANDVIAEKMADIHCIEAPISKQNDWLHQEMKRFLDKISMINVETDVSYNDQDAANFILSNDLKSEVEWVMKCVKEHGDDDLVFCHNDFHSGNILLKKPEHSDFPTDGRFHSKECESDQIDSQIRSIDGSSLVVIDFEFCAYNYRLYDLANHVNEWSYDYTYPIYPYFKRISNCNDVQNYGRQEGFIGSYLSRTRENWKYYNGVDKEKKIKNTSRLTESDVGNILRKVNLFRVAPSLFWCLWSMAHAPKHEEIEQDVEGATPKMDGISSPSVTFGYWLHAMERWNDYKRLKDEISTSM